MNITYVKTFLAVCEYGNFTEAAKKLYIPQPTVSNRIRHLEEELGQDLFVKKEKGKRSVSLTKAGKKFLPYAQQIIQMIDLVKEEIGSPQEKNVLKIGTSIPTSHPFISNKINSIYNEQKDLNLQIFYMNKNAIISSITKNELDIAFIHEPIQNNYVNCIPLVSESYELILSPKHRLSHLPQLLSMNIIQNENLVLLDNYPLPTSLLSKLKQSFQREIVINEIGFVREVIMNTDGITILPSSFFHQEIKQGLIIHKPISQKLVLDQLHLYVCYNRNSQYFDNMFDHNQYLTGII